MAPAHHKHRLPRVTPLDATRSAYSSYYVLFPFFFISFISCLPFWLFVAVTAKAILSGSVNHLEYLDYLLMMVFSL